jgi:misacylated tRNA(Ala) deacylase
MTEKLYYINQYLKEFEAEIVAISEDGQTMALDRSAFYPGGGGQPSDTGTFSIDGETYNVTEAFLEGGFIWHKLDRSAPAGLKGKPLKAVLDWERRYAIMRHHSGLHVLNGVAYHAFGALVSGGQIYADRARMDLTLDDLSQERVEYLERESNVAIGRALDMVPRLVTPDEAAQMPELVRTLNAMPPQSEKMRTMELAGLDRQFCGGTHVNNIRELGTLKIIGTRSKGKNNKRLEIALEL